MEALGTRITTVISGGDGAKRANGKESSGEPTKALASPSIPVALPMTSLCRGAEHFPPLSGSRLSPDLEQHGGVRKACLPQDGHRAELRLDPEETSLSSISIRALRSQLLGRTQRPIQEVCSSESQQMSRGAQERGGEVAQRLAPAPLGPRLGPVGVEGSGLQPRAALFVFPRIPFSDGGPGHGGHQLPWLGLNDLPGGGWEPPPHDAGPIRRVSTGNRPVLTGLPFQKHFFLGKRPLTGSHPEIFAAAH